MVEFISPFEVDDKQLQRRTQGGVPVSGHPPHKFFTKVIVYTKCEIFLQQLFQAKACVISFTDQSKSTMNIYLANNSNLRSVNLTTCGLISLIAN